MDGPTKTWNVTQRKINTIFHLGVESINKNRVLDTEKKLVVAGESEIGAGD